MGKIWLVKFRQAKTESMIFSHKTNIINHPKLFFDNEQVSEVDNEQVSEVDIHKHLWFCSRSIPPVNLYRSWLHTFDRNEKNISFA